MSNPAFLFAIAGISMSFVGFATLFLALRRHEAEWQTVEVRQVNAIVLFGLLTLFSLSFRTSGRLFLPPSFGLLGGSDRQGFELAHELV